MKILATIAQGFFRWIDAVAGTFVTLLGRFASPRVVKLVEDENGEFVLDAGEQIIGSSSTDERIRIAEGRIVGAMSASVAMTVEGSRVELILKPDRFLFRPVELPSRAVEFLDGIVRAQIDRLTPWSVAEVAFGCSRPTVLGPNRIIITVAATALEFLTPYVQAIASASARSVVVFTSLPGDETDAAAIKVLEQWMRGILDIGQIRRALVIIFAAAGIAAGAAVGAVAVISANLDARQDELTRQIASIRAAAGAAEDVASGSVATAQRTLGRRKYDAPSSVVVLETLSQVLPDHTYITELRIEGDKVRLIGVTRDAPSLIGLIEQSSRFTRATFFAPTTRSPSDSSERFHIEAHIQSIVSPRT
jgi:general secretion pathway protein L